MASRSRIAPTFHSARVALHEKLENYVCGILSHNVKIPENGRETDANGKVKVTYYHGLAQKTEPTMRHKNKRKQRTMIWLNKNSRSNRPLQISAAVFDHANNNIPVAGEIIVGPIQHRDDQKASFRYWHGGGKCVWELKKLVQHGTSDFRTLRQKLRTEDKYDDLFVLGAVVLFGDVQLVVDEILQKEGRRFRLNMRSDNPLICFLHKMSVDLKDSTIWDKTIELLPDAEKRLTAASPVVEKTLTVPPLTDSYSRHPLFKDEIPIDDTTSTTTSSWNTLQQQTSNGFLWPQVTTDVQPYTPKSPTYGPPESPTYTPESPTYGPPDSPSVSYSRQCQNLDFLNPKQQVDSNKEVDDESDDDIVLYDNL